MNADYIWRCDLSLQYLEYKKEIDSAISDVFTSGVYIHGKNVSLFEEEFANYIGTKYGVGVNNGTDALIQALICLNVEKGDEVITTPFTAIPTYSAIRALGAKPVFVDIDPNTFLIDISQIKDVISSRTKAIIPVHLFGNAVDVEKLKNLVGSEIKILEDCAQAHGALIGSKKVGCFGDLAAFSFYPTKNLGAMGDGGMVLTNSEEYAGLIRKRRMYGMINKDEFILDGGNTRLDEVQAAILRTKLLHLDAMNQKRKNLFNKYLELLPIEHIKPQMVSAGITSVYHVFCCVCDEGRDELVKFLESRNIQSNIYYPLPLYKQKAYVAQFGKHRELPMVEELTKRIIALPFYPELSEEKLVYITENVKEFFKK